MNTVLAPNAPWPTFSFKAQPKLVAEYTKVRVIKPRKAELTDAILAYLDNYPGAYLDAICADLRKPSSSVGATLNRLREAKRTRSAEGDVYSRAGFLMLRWWRTDQ